jgi:integrase
VFPNTRNAKEPMTENTVLFALYRMGYRGRATGHGFRATASTILNERLKFRPDVIERQLAHVEHDDSRRPYNRSEYLDERTAMMQAWADLIDALGRPGKKKPVPIGKAAA